LARSGRRNGAVPAAALACGCKWSNRIISARSDHAKIYHGLWCTQPPRFVGRFQLEASLPDPRASLSLPWWSSKRPPTTKTALTVALEGEADIFVGPQRLARNFSIRLQVARWSHVHRPFRTNKILVNKTIWPTCSCEERGVLTWKDLQHRLCWLWRRRWLSCRPPRPTIVLISFSRDSVLAFATGWFAVALFSPPCPTRAAQSSFLWQQGS